MQFKWFPNKPTNRPERQSLAFHNADYGINHCDAFCRASDLDEASTICSRRYAENEKPP